MHDVILSKAIMFVTLEANYVAISADEATIVYPNICDVELEMCSNFVDVWKGWSSCKFQQH